LGKLEIVFEWETISLTQLSRLSGQEEGKMKIATAKEVAEFLKLTDSTVYNLATEGKLPAFRIGNSWRFDMDQIMQEIKEAKGVGKNKAGTPRKRVQKTAKK
jgi:excisionase family DNA binding protein